MSTNTIPGAGATGRHPASRGGAHRAGARRCVLALLALLGLAGALPAAEPGPSRPGPDVSAPGDEARAAVSPEALGAGKAALAAAAAAKKAAYALDGEAEEAALLDAARSYGVVADETSYGLDERAEAAFRAGELLRARGRGDDAVQRFAHAVDLGRRAAPDARAREFGARGLLEQAHLLRRDGRESDAVTLYVRVGGEFPGEAKTALQGASWAIKLLVRLDRADEAGLLASGLPMRWSGEPVECVKAVGEWVEALLDAGKPEEASTTIDRLEADLTGALPADDTKMAQRVADAIGALRVTVSASGH